MSLAPFNHLAIPASILGCPVGEQLMTGRGNSVNFRRQTGVGWLDLKRETAIAPLPYAVPPKDWPQNQRALAQPLHPPEALTLHRLLSFPHNATGQC